MAAPGDICAAGSAGEMQSGRGDAAGDDDGAARGAGRGVEAARGAERGVEAARGTGEDGVVAVRGAGEDSARRPGGTYSAGAGTRGGTTGSSGASVEAPVVSVDDPESPGRVPAGKSLCCGPIGSGTVSEASRNSKVAGERGPSRSAKGKAVSSKMTCLEMMMQLEERSR